VTEKNLGGHRPLFGWTGGHRGTGDADAGDADAGAAADADAGLAADADDECDDTGADVVRVSGTGPGRDCPCCSSSRCRCDCCSLFLNVASWMAFSTRRSMKVSRPASSIGPSISSIIAVSAAEFVFAIIDVACCSSSRCRCEC
jgi:hypothetical protein